ncbi:hypothetical protein RFI_05378, partial [Reticulomyxa filosa]
IQTQTQLEMQTQMKHNVIAEKSQVPIMAKIRPFGVKAMVRIFRYLTHLINPNIAENTTEIREFGLRLINVALETSGRFLNKHNELIAIIQDDLCRHLLINSQSQHFGILSLTLRVIFDLFNAVKEVIRVQLEVFFISVHLRIAESSQSSFEQKELVLESIVEFCREPDLIVGLYTNYDCQVGCTHLFEDLCKFLAHQAMPGDNCEVDDLNDLHFIAAEGILAIIDCICRKFCTPSPMSYLKKSQSSGSSTSSISCGEVEMILPPPLIVGLSDGDHFLDGSPESKRAVEDEIEEIRRQQQKKRRLKLAANHFNSKGHHAFEYLQQIGTLQQPLSAQNVSEFFHSNPYLDKTQIGLFLGSEKKFHQEVLQYYTQKFDFRNMSIDEALRLFLESFVLHAESQQVARIIETFSNKYFEEQPKESPIRNKDAAFIMAFSIVQLHTDAHSPQVRLQEKYSRIERRGRLSAQIHEKIYHNITSNEIKTRSGDFRDIFTFGSDLYVDYPHDHDHVNSHPDHNTESAKSGVVGSDNVPTESDKWGGDSGSEYEYSLSGSNDSFFMETSASNTGARSGSSVGVGTGFDVKRSEWKHVLKKSRTSGKFKTIALHSNGMEMFSILWERALKILEFHLQHAGHPKVLERVSQGFKTLTQIAHCYQIRSAFNAIVHSICKNLMIHLHQCAEDWQHETRSLSIQPIGERIAFVLKLFFDSVHSHGGLLLTDGWASVMNVILWLLQLDLIPVQLFELDDFTDSKFEPLPSIRDPPLSESDQNEPDGVWTNWLSSAWNSFFSFDSKQELMESNARNSSSLILKTPALDVLHSTEKHSSANLSNKDLATRTEISSTNQLHKNEVMVIQHAHNSQWQVVCDQVIQCELSKVFGASRFYHLNTLLSLIRTLINLSPSSIEQISTQSHLVNVANDNKQPVSSTQVWVFCPPEAMQKDNELWSDEINEKTEEEKLEDKHTQKEEKEQHVNKDVICLPLSLEMKTFCLERLGQVVLANMDRLMDIWIPVSQHYQNLLRSYQTNKGATDDRDFKKSNLHHNHVPDFMFERVIVHVMKLCSYLSDIPDPKIRSEITIFLHLIWCLDDAYLFAVGRRVIAGLVLLLSVERLSILEDDDEYGTTESKKEEHIPAEHQNLHFETEDKREVTEQRKHRKSFRCIVTENDWAIVLRLLKRFASCDQDKQCCLEAFQLVETISKEHEKEVHFVLLLEVLLSFARSESDAAVHCKRVIDVIYVLHNDIANFTDMSPQKLNMMWYKTLHAISNFGTNVDYQTRRYAINCLQVDFIQLWL